MKKLIALFLISTQLAYGANEFRAPNGIITPTALVGGTTRNASAVLDINSTTQGLGLPNMTGTQMTAISSPKTGLAVFNTTTNQINVYNGTTWVAAGSGGTVYAADSGTANAYVISPTPAAISYAAGGSYAFLSLNANTGASTLNVSSLGVKAIKNPAGGALVTGDILASQIVVVTYDGTNFQMVSPQGPAVSANTANTLVKRNSSGGLPGNSDTATNLAGNLAQPSPSPSSIPMYNGTSLINVPFPGPSASPSGYPITALGNGNYGLQQTQILAAPNGVTPSPVATIQVPVNQLTNTGTNTAMIETGNSNMLANPNFLSSAPATSWTLGSGVTAFTDTSTVYQNDKQSLKLLFTAFTGELLLQDAAVQLGSVAGVAEENTMIVNPSVAGLQVCSRTTATHIQCLNAPAGVWTYLPASSIGASTDTSVGVSLYAPSSVTGLVHVARAYVGPNRNLSSVSLIGPVTVQRFLSGSGTYTPTTLANLSYIMVEMAGGGGGGGGTTSGGGATAGGNGGTTTFGSSFLSTNGGGGGQYSAGGGGAASCGSLASCQPLTGGTGNSGGTNGTTSGSYLPGGGGGVNPFGGGGAGGYGNGPAVGSPVANTGGGGGGSGCSLTASCQSAGGGGAGGYLKAWIAVGSSTWLNSYAYSVAAGGTAGVGTFAAGLAGGSGIIIVTEYYGSTANTFNPNLQTAYAATTMSSSAVGVAATSFTTATGVSSRSNYGIAQTPATSGQMAMTVPSLQPGSYLAIFKGPTQNNAAAAGQICNFQLTDGTSSGFSFASVFAPASGANAGPNIIGFFNYAAVQTNLTFSVQAAANATGPTCFASGVGTSTIILVPLSQNVVTPVIPGNVITKAPLTLRVETGQLTATSASVCSISAVGTGLFFSTTPIGLGNCTGTFAIPFTVAPQCFFGINGASTNAMGAVQYLDTTTGLTIVENVLVSGSSTINGTSAPLDVTCIGH